jgi:hypothetical protein
VSFIGGCLAQDKGFCGGIFDGWVRRDGIPWGESMELFYVAVVTECICPPAGVLELAVFTECERKAGT